MVDGTCTNEAVRHLVGPCRAGCELCSCFSVLQCSGPPRRNLHGRLVVVGEQCAPWLADDDLAPLILRDRVRARLQRGEVLDRIDALFEMAATTILLEVVPELRSEIERRPPIDALDQRMDLVGELGRRLRGHVATTLEGLMRGWPRDRVELECSEPECATAPLVPSTRIWFAVDKSCAWDPCTAAAQVAAVVGADLEEAQRYAAANAIARLLPVSAGWLAPEIAAALSADRPQRWAVRRALAMWLEAPPIGYVIEPSEAKPGWVRWRCEATGETSPFERRADALEDAWTHAEPADWGPLPPMAEVVDDVGPEPEG